MAAVIDSAYAQTPRSVPLLSHHYGPRVHVLHDALLLRELASLCVPACPLPTMITLVRSLYASLLRAVVLAQFPRETVACTTRMAAPHPEAGIWRGEVAAAPPHSVVVDIARAGTVPAQTCFELLMQWFGPDCVRQDHLSVSRQIDAHGAAHVHVHKSKIGGPCEGRWLILPDPMGATGTSMEHAVRAYEALPPGPPGRIIALHLIVTPEYLAHAQQAMPQLDVWALRVDRGLSAADVLARPLGADWAAERGLNEHAYIVPGAGGVGELLNNADE